MNEQQAVVLLSGGLDSTTVLAIARSQGFACNCLSFRYGQRQAIELDRAQTIAQHFGAVRHLVLRVDLDAIGGSALTDAIEVPKDRPFAEMEQTIPVTYVPGRNIIFLAHALSWAEVLGAADIFLGINAIDYSGYPDCRPEFLDAFARMANLGTRAGTTGMPFRLHAPLIHLSKKEIILKGTELGVDYGLTHSCYDPEGDRACGRCDACRLRLQGFREAGLTDPAPYVIR
ncbi:7-cyano-7-deazaguanine synthase QueC [Desulfobulbus elongatus]|uniref:7-cyano-7-deazaguanine synthase QueC n=1 Tax=Desulfobulbus elongatus TaxID=53332 RepID=UPI00048489A8|nr:7-cyano-7-deazaguanine synthase QueC [Desulfobulbus elongatus]